MNFIAKNVQLTLLQVILVHGLKSINFCNLIQKECLGSYDSSLNYTVTCNYMKCKSPYGFNCGKNRCAKNQDACFEFLNIEKYLNSFTYRDTFDSYFGNKMRLLKEQDIFKFDSFKKKFRNCPKHDYEWKDTDICINGKSCYSKKELPNKNSFFSLFVYKKFTLNQIDCPCIGLNTYRCGKDHCAMNQISCDYFKKNILSDNSLQLCGNDLIIYEKSFRLNIF